MAVAEGGGIHSFVRYAKSLRWRRAFQPPLQPSESAPVSLQRLQQRVLVSFWIFANVMGERQCLSSASN